MKNIGLKILNERSGVLAYLPYGVTTLGMMIEGARQQSYGYIYPRTRTAGKNKTYVGYADGRDDFLVVWGGGRENGLEVNRRNVNGRLFLQLIHTGKTMSNYCISLLHSNDPVEPIKTVRLVPADQGADLVRMVISREDDQYYNVSFVGSRMPLYYPRWFPPQISTYHKITLPPLAIKFKLQEMKSRLNINSDLSILLGRKKVGQVSGDWKYSYPHAELFTLFGDSRYLVMRLWFYWLHKNFSERFILRGPETASRRSLILQQRDVRPRLRWVEPLDIECPDIERFDFLFDTNREKIIWLGTDFHYQELWYKLDEREYVRARIANPFNTVDQAMIKGISRLMDKLGPKKVDYNPAERLKQLLKDTHAEKNLDLQSVGKEKLGSDSKTESKKDAVYLREGVMRKHIPYTKDGGINRKFISSVVTG